MVPETTVDVRNPPRPATYRDTENARRRFADEITIVVNTHLHFDHAGGNTSLNAEGNPVVTFPNARYFVSGAELDHGYYPTERDRASYLPENWKPLVEAGQLEPRDADYEVVPGLKMETIAGHNRSMQCWRLERNGNTMFGFADLIPMRAHVRLPWIMGYDLYPVETLEAKKRILPQAARENWICMSTTILMNRYAGYSREKGVQSHSVSPGGLRAFMSTAGVRVGIIGGSGLYQMPELTAIEELELILHLDHHPTHSSSALSKANVLLFCRGMDVVIV